MTCFVTFNTGSLDKLRSLFCGCGLIFKVGDHKGVECVTVTLPRVSVEEQKALLSSVYRHAARLG